MSGFAFPDILGPQEISSRNAPVVALRKRVRVRGGVTLSDDPGARCTRMRFPHEYAFSAVTVSANLLASDKAPWLAGVSSADLIRVEATASASVLEGIADVVSLGAFYYAVRAVPNKPMKVLVNVGTHTLKVQPPAAAPDDPNRAGIFMDAVDLSPGMAVRIVWDGVDFAYRIHAGRRVYLTYQGQYVVHQGQRIYYYPDTTRRMYLTYQGQYVVHEGRRIYFSG